MKREVLPAPVGRDWKKIDFRSRNRVKSRRTDASKVCGIRVKVRSSTASSQPLAVRLRRSAALSQIRSFARRMCCAVGQGYAPFNARLHHGTLIASTRMQKRSGPSKMIYSVIAHWDSNGMHDTMFFVQQGCASRESTTILRVRTYTRVSGLPESEESWELRKHNDRI
jgi:hypothetical protein